MLPDAHAEARFPRRTIRGVPRRGRGGHAAALHDDVVVTVRLLSAMLTVLNQGALRRAARPSAYCAPN